MGGEFRVTSAPALEKPKDLAGILMTVTEGAVFFIDEIHRLKPVLEEMLYIAMEDFQIDWVIGQGASARTVRIPVKSFTLIGATTKAGLVASPLYSRFGINIRFDYYSAEELLKIVYRSAAILDIRIEDDAALLLAGCSRGTPRIANRLLRRMRDFAQVFSDGVITKKIVAEGLGRLAIDSYGLESHDREILKTIIGKYGGGPVGADTLAISVGESNDTLEDFYEPYLIQRGFLQRTPRGRIATPLAYEHLGLTPKNVGDENQGLLF
jgi:Holliday junction DNA helicase RuvB